MSKIPPGYAAPLKSRAAIVAFLTERANDNPRKGYGLFTYNVKLRNLRDSFTDLCKVAREAGELAPDASPRYLAEVEDIYNDQRETIWDQAIEDAGESVLNDVGNRMLWDGPAEEIADWELAGRSGGWLALKRFDGVDLSKCDPEQFTEFPYEWLRRLYRFLIQCDHDFRRPESEVEYKAAFSLFQNYARGVKTDEQQAEIEAAAEREASERAYWETRDMVTA